MTHQELLTLALSVHSGVLMASVAAFYKYGDRSSFAKNLVENARETKQALRYRIAEQLRECLRPVFEDVDVIDVSPILDASGDPWSEEAVNPAGGEKYRDALADFLNSEADAVGDYRTMRIIVPRWEAISCVRSWLVLLTVIWEGLALALIGSLEKLGGYKIRESLLEASLAPTILAVLAFFVASGFMMYLHDQILRLARQYE